mmetsp:Transcript_61327/g.176465  ORF Transcript_61327/g.176465 Transcript_61327/m.176465 type:complete len:233 (+) Transcript_61327:1154-1852(+)
MTPAASIALCIDRPGSSASMTERTNSQLLHATAQPKQYNVASRQNFPRPDSPASFTEALRCTPRQYFMARCVSNAHTTVNKTATVEDNNACTTSSLEISMNHSTSAFVFPTETEMGIHVAASMMIAKENLLAYGLRSGSVIQSWQLHAKIEQPTSVVRKSARPKRTQRPSFGQCANQKLAATGSWSVAMIPMQSKHNRATTAMTTVAAIRTYPTTVCAASWRKAFLLPAMPL